MMQRHLDGSVSSPQGSLRGLFSARIPTGPVALPENATWSLEVEAGATLRLRTGSAWVTFEGDAEDHILSGPACFTAPRRGRVALWALSPARFEVEVATPRRAA